MDDNYEGIAGIKSSLSLLKVFLYDNMDFAQGYSHSLVVIIFDLINDKAYYKKFRDLNLDIVPFSGLNKADLINVAQWLLNYKAVTMAYNTTYIRMNEPNFDLSSTFSKMIELKENPYLNDKKMDKLNWEFSKAIHANKESLEILKADDMMLYNEINEKVKSINEKTIIDLSSIPQLDFGEINIDDIYKGEDKEVKRKLKSVVKNFNKGGKLRSDEKMEELIAEKEIIVIEQYNIEQ